jgi:adenylate cyclase class 2
MAFEVELKFRDADHPSIRTRLAAAGAEPLGTVDQVDSYLAHPSRDFASTGEALRLRRVGTENLITYKGPKLPGPAKTREEIELAFQPGPDAFSDLSLLWNHLGFLPVATVRKTRDRHRLSRSGLTFEIALDTVAGLGPFAEIETIAPSPDDLLPAQQAVVLLASELGLPPDSIEPRSYLRMLLSSHGPPQNAQAHSTPPR